jgi:hypothetical protein
MYVNSVMNTVCKVDSDEMTDDYILTASLLHGIKATTSLVRTGVIEQLHTDC